MEIAKMWIVISILTFLLGMALGFILRWITKDVKS